MYMLRCRSLTLAESTAVDDMMSECGAALMQEQVDNICDADAGKSLAVIFVIATWYYNCAAFI